MLRWMDGFEHYGTDESFMLDGVGGAAAWSEVDSSWALSTTNPATGTYHMRLTGGSNAQNHIRRAVGQSKQVVGFGYRFNVADLPTHEATTSIVNQQLVMCYFNDVANSEQFRLGMGTEGSVYASRTTTFLGRSDPCIAAGGYHHFEAKSKIDNTTGYVEVRINEVTVLNLTGIDTQTTGTAETSQVRVSHIASVGDSSNAYGTMDLDDCFLWDDDSSDAENTIVDFVGDKGCYYLAPDADTATSEWTVNGSATAYGAIDEVPPNATDYLDNTDGTARTIVSVGALPGNVSEVLAYMPVIYARKEESGTVNLRGGVVVNGDESYTPTNSPSTEYAYMEPGPKTINPDTGVAWDSSTVPDLLIERTV